MRSQPAPEKKFVFPAENLAIHQSEASLGPSYSFWLPWDNAGGQQRRLSLLTRFEDKSGKIVMSKTAHVLLPGMPAAPESGQAALPASQPVPPTAAVPGGLGMTEFAPGEVHRQRRVRWQSRDTRPDVRTAPGRATGQLPRARSRSIPTRRAWQRHGVSVGRDD